MWHEARKQERMIRGMIVDYRRRAERRKDFYEKIKADPTQFLQLHGRPCKIHLDPAVAAAGEGPAIMMPWQGDPNNMIDRFDVRAHLDYIPEVKNPDVPPESLSPEERQCNYERYRILAQNAFLGISEDKFLQQLAIEEQFGVTIEEKEMQKEKLNEKKGVGVAIGYNYNDPGSQPSCSHGPEVKKVEPTNDSDDDSDLEIIDVDLSIDVNKMEPSQAHELNLVGPSWGMAGCDLFSFLTGDADDAEHQKQLLREEKEKAMFSGRKSRRERRAHRDKKLACRVVSPPSYAAPAHARARSESGSASRSPSPVDNIQFITEFGGEEEEQPPLPPKISYADKVKQNLKKIDLYSDVVRKNKSRSPSSERFPVFGPRRESRSRSRSRSYSRSRSRSKSRSRSRSRSYRRSLSSVSSRSRSRSYSPRRSRSRSRPRYRRRSTSPANYASKRKSRSISRESGAGAGVGSGPAPVPRYYGRRAEDKSSSELSVDSDSSDDADHANNKSAVGNKSNSNQNQLRLSGPSSKSRPSREAVSLKEKLKRKMQAQLSRQLRADKRAEAERLERDSRRQARRDHEMRELAIKLRRKQREMRHQQSRRSSDDDSDKSRSGSSSRQSPRPDKPRESRSRSKSSSPTETRAPVWETNKPSPPHRDKEPSPEPSHARQYRQHDQDEKPPPPFPRYDKFPNRIYERHDNYNRQDYNQGYDNRWEDKRYHAQGPRRPYGHRGGYRGHGNRPDYGDGPSWQKPDDRDRNSSNSDPNKSRVKLVDY